MLARYSQLRYGYHATRSRQLAWILSLNDQPLLFNVTLWTEPLETLDIREILVIFWKNALTICNASGICDHARIGPEAEFFVFDDVRYGESMGHSMYQVDSGEAFWNSGRQEPGGNLAYKNRAKEGYFPSPPFDTLVDLRNDMVAVMESIGMHVEAAHHEVAAAGQCEIDFRFGGMMETADALGWYKYIVRNVAKQHGKSATFMPKPLLGDNGSGMHQHYSLHDASGKNLFTGDGPAGLSEMALYFIGGIISTPTPSWPSPTPEPTVTSDLCQDLKHQSSPLTPAETAPRSAAFPFPIQKDDALNSERPIPRATPTSHSLQSCKPEWTELKTRSTLATLAISTFTKLLPRSLQTWVLKESHRH
eukprot:UN01306